MSYPRRSRQQHVPRAAKIVIHDEVGKDFWERPLAGDQVREAVDRLRAQAVEALVIHSYLNDSHERRREIAAAQ